MRPSQTFLVLQRLRTRRLDSRSAEAGEQSLAVRIKRCCDYRSTPGLDRRSEITLSSRLQAHNSPAHRAAHEEARNTAAPESADCARGASARASHASAQAL